MRKKIEPSTAPDFDLTPQELTIVRALCEGRTVEGAALVVGLSRWTTSEIVTHSIFKKMGIHSQVCMAVKAERANLLDGVLT